MATHYYWQEGQEIHGPVSFQELVDKVRDLRINEDHLIRADYLKDWQTADTVVGLFYMAKRIPIPRAAPVPELPPESATDGSEFRVDDFDEMLERSQEIVDSNDDSASEAANPFDGSAIGLDGMPTQTLVDLIGPGIDQARSTEFVAFSSLRRVQAWLVRYQCVLLAAVLLIVVGGGWSGYVMGRSADIQRYLELQRVLKEINNQRSAPQPNFGPAQALIDRIVREYPDKLLRDGASRRHPVRQKMLFVARDILPTMLKSDLKIESIAEIHMKSRLDEVARDLGYRE